MRIMIVTDAWLPQTNGVVRTLSQTMEWLGRFGHEVRMLTPQDFRSIACPTYPEIRLSLLPRKLVEHSIAEFSPQALHIATEGPLGLAARRYCLRRNLRFTTSYHTQFPQYLRARFPIPIAFSYWVLHRFHGAAARCMVSTLSLRTELQGRGFKNLAAWRRGVDTQLFKPGAKDFLDMPRPIAAYVGRVAVEKNVEAFLRMPWDGSKIVIGDGPERAGLEARYPKVARRALTLDPKVCRENAVRCGWDASAREFEGNLVSCHSSQPPHRGLWTVEAAPGPAAHASS
jgi:glycosyltransferase involved in cell wall biosynthesis